MGLLVAQPSIEKSTTLIDAYLTQNREAYGLSPLDWELATLSDQYTSAHNGITHLYLQQTWNGIALRGAILNANIWQGKVLSLHHRFVKDLATKAPSAQPAISPEVAINAAATHLGLSDYSSIQLHTRPQGATLAASFLVPGLSNEPVSVKLSWIEAANSQVRLAWELRIYTTDHQHWWGVWVDAQTQQILGQEDWVVTCSWKHSESLVLPGSAIAAAVESHQHELRLAKDDLQLYAPFRPMATPEYRVFPMPVESPNHGVRQLVSDPSNATASPFGWHDTDGLTGEEFTITRGNNVWAQEDRNGDNGTGLSPNAGPTLSFDYPLPTGVAPINYLDASTTNLFFWNNLMHDVWYQYGFDEVSGNFQANNYGKGGIAGDFVLADGQDGSGSNNANFATPPDGNPGRMQMFLWANGGSSPDVLTVNSPAGIAGSYSASGANFGPGIPLTPLTRNVVLAIDSTGGSEICTGILNPADLDGKIALVDRGTCQFPAKVLRCQQAGALAVIVVNNAPGNTFQMGGGNAGAINIPAIMITQADGNLIKNALQAGIVNATIFDQGDPNARDGGFDNGVIAHEYGHGISTRLTGGPSTSCLFNEEQAGEGWSDFFSLVMTVEAGDTGNDPRGIGTFAIDEPVTGVGIRNFPYSTNMQLSPYTYDLIKTLSIPHGVGSVMCATLWDLYWRMIEEYGFDSDVYNGTGGNNMAMQLVMDGLKLQPCGPGFLDVRDAILLADQVNNDAANRCLIWEVFARRGMGYSADQGDPDSRADGVEAFDLPPFCLEILYMEKTTDAGSVQQGGNLRYQFTLSNLKDTLVTNVVITDTLPEPLQFVANSATCPVSVNGNIVTMTIDTIKAGEVVVCECEALVPASAAASSFSFNDDLEGSVSAYLQSAQVGGDGWYLDSTKAYSGTHSWFVPNTENTNDQILTLPIAPLLSPSTLTFWHEYNTEGGWDGGIVEILPTQSGGQWLDLGPFILSNGYNTTLGANNPAGAVSAFSGSSGGFINTKIDLSNFLGQQLFLRFRFLSDDNTAVDGWRIDDIRIGNEVQFSNSACLESAEGDVYCSEQKFPTLIFAADSMSLGIAPELLNPFNMTLAPNPATNQVMVSWSGHESLPVTVSLRNMVGQLLLTENMGRGETNALLSLQMIPAGVYLVELTDGSSRSFMRLVVE